MRIISRRALKEYWAKHPDAERPLPAWYNYVKRADWKTPSDIKDAYRNASFLENNRVVFNIKENFYRLIVAININMVLSKSDLSGLMQNIIRLTLLRSEELKWILNRLKQKQTMKLP